jgi:hypothetical protein
MNDIDFIKWMCEKAEGWTYRNHLMIKSLGYRDTIKSPDGNVMVDEDFDSKDWGMLYYPLLLQRAFWGCGEISSMQISLTGQFCFQLRHHPMNITHRFSTEDECYESALKYIYEHTK